MANTNAPSVATSAVAVSTIGGLPLDTLESTLFDIGFQSCKAEQAMEEGKSRLDTLDANLYDFVKGIPYDEYSKVREIIITGAVDAGRTADAAQKQFERQVGRMSRAFGFVKPKSESKDAVRKAEAKAKEVEKLASFEDGELEDLKDGLLRKGDNKSLNEAKKINAELTRRNASAIDAEKAELKALVDKINTRVKELSKSGTPDAVELLTQVAMILG